MQKLLAVLLVAILLISLAECAPLSKGTKLLQLQPRETYDLNGIGEDYITYRFKQPNNNFVVYCIRYGNYILLEKDCIIDNCYAITHMNGYEFLGISEKYWLFRGKEGKVVVDLNSNAQLGLEANSGDYSNHIHPYDELPENDKSGFVYYYRIDISKSR